MDEDKEKFFVETLAQAKAYRELVVYDSEVNYPPIAVLISKAEETVTTWRRESSDSLFAFDAQPGSALAPLTSPGDGRICVLKSDPPQGVSALPCA